MASPRSSLHTYFQCLPMLFGFMITLASPAAMADPSVAFYYGSDLPGAALAQYDQVVVQADEAEAAQVALLRKRGSKVFAYVSLSEVGRLRASAAEKSCRIGDNNNWDTFILDSTRPECQRQLIDTRFQPLWDRGFHAFFLDNLDSYQQVVKGAAGLSAQVRGLSQIIKDLHARFPGVELLFNRGFELLPEVAPLAVGVVAESLFRSWDPASKNFVEVKADERNELLGALRTARDRYHLPVTVIDYVPVTDRELARTTARRILALGMTPWVTEQTLTTIGIGAVEVVPRRILAIYGGDKHELPYLPIHTMAAVILEYLGYAVDYVDATGPLPSGHLETKYAGIVTWLSDDRLESGVVYRDWLLRQIDSGIKVAILDRLGFIPDQRFMKKLGFTHGEHQAVGDVRLLTADPQATGFETKVVARQNIFYPLEATDRNARRLLSVEDSSGTRMDAVFTSWWGGIAAKPYLLDEGPVFRFRWVINPFVFFKQALALPEVPAADITTLDGHRMLIVHIDGDGFPSRARMPGNDYSGKVILEQILKHYLIKTTVSVIEGEVGPEGKFPKLSAELEVIARDMFALPHVEVASHSYSHPFDWRRFGKRQEDGDVNGLFVYDASLRREVNGSVEYINRRLAPPSKPVKVFLWSGEAVAPQEALAQVESAGLLNMNGGNTTISFRAPTLTRVAPMGRPVGPYYQVYAPVQNEIIFTNEFRGPWYGFRDVISSFQLTDSPHRLKPINIYYHMFSGSKIASLKALRKVLDWALLQDVTSVYGSEYIRKVLDFQSLTLARRQDGCWQLRGDGSLTTLRLDSTDREVDLAHSRGVVGSRDLPQGRYVSLDASGRALLCMQPTAGVHSAAIAKER